MIWTWLAAISLLFAYCPDGAGAQQLPDATDSVNQAITKQKLNAERTKDEVKWDPRWRRFRIWQYSVSALMLGGILAVRFTAPRPLDRWHGGILLDDSVRDLVAVRAPQERRIISSYTDFNLYLSLLYMALDPIITAGAVYHDWDVALQMGMINLQSTAFVLLTVWSLQYPAGRARPYQQICADPTANKTSFNCNPDSLEWNRSFISGHTAVAITAAALTCVHHDHMPLYGGGFWDDFTCGTSIALAGLNGLGRIMTENHWPSDVFFAAVLGSFAGWFVPSVLHYGFTDHQSDEQKAENGASHANRTPSFFVMPYTTDNTFGLQLLGAF